MYNNDDYEEEQEETTSGSTWKSLYENNKKLIWILCGIIIAILLLSLITSGRNNTPTKDNIEVVIKYNDVEKESLVMAKDNTISLKGEVTGVKNGIVKWNSSNPDIVRVTSNGNVVGIGLGTCIVTASYSDDDKVNKKIEITVVEGDPNIQVTTVTFPEGDWIIGVGKSATLNLNVIPEKGSIKSKKFKSSNPSVVTVSEDGVIKALSKGSAKITADINDGKFEPSVMVYVIEEVSIAIQTKLADKLDFRTNVQKIKINQAYQLDYTISPSDADMSMIKWKSNDESIAKVSSNGVVSGIKEGSTIVEAYSITGATLGSIHIEVEEDIIDVRDVLINGQGVYTIEMEVNKTQTIVPTVKPDDASNKTLTFKTSDSSVVAISNTSGVSTLLYAMKVGVSQITITSDNGKSCYVTVVVKSSSSGGGSSSGGSGSGSGSVNEYDIKGYKIRSYDKDGNGFVNRDYASASGSNSSNGDLTIEFTLESVDKLKICRYKYGGTPCDPDKDTNVTVIDKNSLKTILINENGIWVIRVSEYTGNNKVRNTLNWYANIGNAGSGGGAGQQQGDFQISNCTSTVMSKGDYKALSVSGRSVNWTSSNTNVATVSQTGSVQAVNCTTTNNCSVTITATDKSDSTKKATCVVQVKGTGGTEKTPTINWNTKKAGHVTYGLGTILNVTFMNANISNASSSFSVYYCVTKSDCTININDKKNWYNRTFIPDDKTGAKTCISANEGSTYFVDANGDKNATSFTSNSASINFCFEPSQKVRVLARANDGSWQKDFGLQSFS